MLPFARMVKYGNKIPPPAGIRKINTYGLGHLFLTTDGKLFAYGSNNEYRFGTPTTSIVGGVPSLVLINVAMIYCHPAYTICLMNDGTYMAAGNLSQFGLGSQTSFVDVSSFFSTLGTITKIAITRRETPGTSTIYALNSTGILYAMGSNNRGQFGNNTLTGKIGEFVQINTNCKDVVTCSYETVVVLKNDNTAWFCGNYGLTSGSSDIKVFTNIGDTDILSINSDGSGGSLLYTKSTGLYVRGLLTPLYGLTYTSGSQGTNRLAVLPFTYDSANFRYWTDPEGQGPSCWIQDLSTGTRYATGSTNSSNGRLGFSVPSASGNSFREQVINLPEGTSTMTVLSVGMGNNYSALISTDGIVYGSGAFNGYGAYPGTEVVNYPGSNPTLFQYEPIKLGI